jgi:hypothetical protein
MLFNNIQGFGDYNVESPTANYLDGFYLLNGEDAVTTAGDLVLDIRKCRLAFGGRIILIPVSNDGLGSIAITTTWQPVARPAVSFLPHSNATTVNSGNTLELKDLYAGTYKFALSALSGKTWNIYVAHTPNRVS